MTIEQLREILSPEGYGKYIALEKCTRNAVKLLEWWANCQGYTLFNESGKLEFGHPDGRNYLAIYSNKFQVQAPIPGQSTLGGKRFIVFKIGQ